VQSQLRLVLHALNELRGGCLGRAVRTSCVFVLCRFLTKWRVPVVYLPRGALTLCAKRRPRAAPATPALELHRCLSPPRPCSI
jgi:hypothetical protein